ncbi:MAG: protocatechuate 3,4-dioxygenase subunit beta, partial [Rhodococcus sp. (in: high G+C Gram-positive bacteria)]|nr:protocatechuate 3,4-dioxygenase subunit beta [Rhodococcus sp. (in: high G+C Gram-positive bacteria)]
MLHLPPRYQRPTGVNAPADFADYKTTSLRHPKQPLKLLPQRLTELTGPVFGEDRVGAGENDLTIANGGEAQGQRI